VRQVRGPLAPRCALRRLRPGRPPPKASPRPADAPLPLSTPPPQLFLWNVGGATAAAAAKATRVKLYGDYNKATPGTVTGYW
jgi:hypothetical protein